jgi:hypothetical protein
MSYKVLWDPGEIVMTASVETFLPVSSSFQSADEGVSSISSTNINHCGIAIINAYQHTPATGTSNLH